MPKLTLYHAVPSRSSIVRWMLEEVGEPYDLHLLNLLNGEQNTPAYRAINPMRKVPALKHGDVVITEAAAICCYLADAFPVADLAVPIGEPERGTYLKWLFFGPSCFEPAVTANRFPYQDGPPRTALGFGDYETVIDVLTKAVAEGPHLMGDKFTAADVVIGSGLRWGMMFDIVPKAPEFMAYVDRLAARPALQRATALDQEIAKEQRGDAA